MALSTEERTAVARGLSRWWSGINTPLPNILISDVIAAVGDTDDWIDANQASFNSALPQAIQNNLTLAQKTLLFCGVAVARVSLDFLRRILGGV